jgi:nucleoside-diphosphate-sugar epimerase
MPRVLVTGAAGFIGYHTALQLLNDGVTVVGIDNLNDYYDVRLKQHRLDQLKKHPGFEFQKIDIESKLSLEPLFEAGPIDVIFNLAARAGVRYSMENPHVYITTNAMGQLNLLDCAVKFKIPKVVMASTSSLYAGQKMPFTEDLPVNTPISPYAASKKAAEMLSYSYHYLYGIDISIVRYFTVYGPAGRPDMSIFRFIRWIDEGTPIELFGDGNQSRDFTYVEDIARGTIAAAKLVGFEVINLGGGMEPVTLNEVIQQIEQLLGKRAKLDYKPFHKADILETQADISKATKLLGWRPSVSLNQGIKKTVDWYVRNHDEASCYSLP